MLEVRSLSVSYGQHRALEDVSIRVDKGLFTVRAGKEFQGKIARSYADAPEIDGNVIVPGSWDLDPGDFIEVEVTDALDHDLRARPVED